MGLEDRQYYQEDEQVWRSGMGAGPPKWSAVGVIIVICVVIFLLDAFTAEVRPGAHWLMDILALKTDQLWKVWTFLTHGFAHSSIDSKSSFFHVGLNMLVLFFLGRPIEKRLGTVEFVKFYLISILFAALMLVLVRLATGVPCSAVGASGAVTAVVMLFVFYYPKEQLLLMGILPMPAWVVGVLVVATDISRSFDPTSDVAWEAHLGGALFAAIYYLLKLNFHWLPLERLNKLSFKRKPRLSIHDPNGGVDRKLQQQADAILAKIADEGEDSLTNKERRILNRYSKQLRKNRD